MSELSQEEMRRRRLARLAGLESNASNPVSPPGPSVNNVPESSSSPGPSTCPDLPTPSLHQQQSPAQPQVSESSSEQEVPMDFEETNEKQSNNISLDVDSGIENMEVEEQDRKDHTSRSRTTSSSADVSTDQIHSTISRVLRVSWKQPTEQTIFLPELSANVSSFERTMSHIDIINESLMEVLKIFTDNEDPLKDITSDILSDGEDSPNSQTSPMVSPAAATSSLASSSAAGLPMVVTSENKNKPRSFFYLVDCYSRAALEERNNPERLGVPPMSEVLISLRAQCVQYASLVLQQRIRVPVDKLINPSSVITSPLLYPVLAQTTTRFPT